MSLNEEVMMSIHNLVWSGFYSLAEIIEIICEEIYEKLDEKLVEKNVKNSLKVKMDEEIDLEYANSCAKNLNNLDDKIINKAIYKCKMLVNDMLTSILQFTKKYICILGNLILLIFS